MATQILYLHWKTIRLGLLPLTLAAFGLPLLAVQGLGRPEGLGDVLYTPLVLQTIGSRLLMFPILAGVLGVTLALSSWSPDHEAKHVYALSLPIARWRYALLKFGAGVLLALVPTAALLAGGYAATAALELPPLLRAYPAAVAVRFLFATLLVYALVFAFAAGSIRTTVLLLTAFVAFVVMGGPVLDFIGSMVGTDLVSGIFIERVMDSLTRWPGPFHILAGNWALIDV